MTVVQVAVRAASSGTQMVAPVTGNSVGLRRAEIMPGVREVILCKDQDGKIGMRVQAVNKVLLQISVTFCDLNKYNTFTCLLHNLPTSFGIRRTKRISKLP